MQPPAETTASPEHEALLAALGRLLAAMARLSVARGLPFATVEELLKQAFVDAASAAHPGLPEHRKVSRISTTTGINRREVTRLTRTERSAGPRAGRSPAAAVFTHWSSMPEYRSADGELRALPRSGLAPSFETLAQSVTRDVHPRSLLDELCRLGLAEWDEASDTVQLSREGYVPRGDRVRMLRYLGDNVGSHLDAATDNVLQGDRTHFEQAVLAHGLSAASIAQLRPAIAALWQDLLRTVVPEMERLVAADEAAAGSGPAPEGRLRVGLYSYQEGAAVAPSAPAAAPTARPPSRRKTKDES